MVLWMRRSFPARIFMEMMPFYFMIEGKFVFRCAKQKNNIVRMLVVLAEANIYHFAHVATAG